MLHWIRQGQRVRLKHEPEHGFGREGILAISIGRSAVREHPRWAVMKDNLCIWVGEESEIGSHLEPIPDPALPPGIMRDLAERQATRRETQEERIRRVLTAAGATEGSSTAPGILLSRNGDGRVIVRWGMKRDDGSSVSCAWTEAAEQALETARRELQEEGIPACVGAPAEVPLSAQKTWELQTENAQLRAENIRLTLRVDALLDALVAVRAEVHR